MNPLEMLVIALVMIAQSTAANVEKENITLDLTASNVIVELTMCNPLIPTNRTQRRARVFVRCITNDRQWNEGWTARPEQGGVLVWRAFVASPQRHMKLPPTPEKQKQSKEIFDFGSLNDKKEI